MQKTVKPRLQYLKRLTDRHGKPRLYFNRPGFPRVPLPLEDDPRFPQAYAKALALPAKDEIAAEARRAPEPIRPSIMDKRGPGTFSDLCRRFYLSSAFLNLGPSTQRTYRNAIERIRNKHGEKPVAMLDRRGVKNIIAAEGGRPGAANTVLRMLRMLMNFAIDEEDRGDNPTLGIKKLRGREGGLIAWREEDIDRFLARHGPGSKARLAMVLLLYTAQRRSDIVNMGARDLRAGGTRISVVQIKTKARLEIPVHPELAHELAGLDPDAPAFVLNQWGRPFASPACFGNWFRDRCAEAGLPTGYNAHGLRKAACRRLAEAGCTAHEIAAISGHKTLGEVQRYTQSANQVTMAEAAMRKVQGGVDPFARPPANRRKPYRQPLGTEIIMARPKVVILSNDNFAVCQDRDGRKRP